MSVCLSLTATMWNNFWPHGRIITKFSGSTKLLASIFWAGSWDIQALWFWPKPQKGPHRVLWQAGGVIRFWKQEAKAKNWWELNFDFPPTTWENGARRQGWPGEMKTLELQHFSLKGPLLKSGADEFWIHVTFWFDSPQGHPQYPWAQKGGN